VTLDPALVERLYAAAGAGRWNLAIEHFSAALEASARSGSGVDAGNARGVRRYLENLHLDDLALACACAAGEEDAWDHFVAEYRPTLYRAAQALDAPGNARELADSLYADLFGLRERGGERQSLFRYFHGRSSLATWLRAVLAQRYVDRVRSGRRIVPLPDDDAQDARRSAAPEDDPECMRLRPLVIGALRGAVAALEPRDRLRLSCYYAQRLTLAQVGRILGEHEATVSRQLTRTRSSVRRDVERRLLEQHLLSGAAVARAFECVLQDPGAFDIVEAVSAAERKNSRDDRSTDEDAK
jgi:RNA polymerase sigma-70 factor (ECF subfamily)